MSKLAVQWRADAWEVGIADASLRLLSDRALWWAEQRTLFVADVHLGKAEAFRARGVPVPYAATERTLERLDALVRSQQASRLVVLGDLVHSREAHEAATLEAMRAWRGRHHALHVMLVGGNHDRAAGGLSPALGIEQVSSGESLGPFRLHHEPPTTAAADGGYALAGHLHPAVRIGARARQSLRLPCFWFRREGAVLPAYGEFTGAHAIAPADNDRVFGIADGNLFEVPPTRNLNGSDRIDR